MSKTTETALIVLSVMILIASIIMFGLNHYYFRYPGLFYFDPAFLSCALFLMMVRFGLKLQFNLCHDNTWIKMLGEAAIYSMTIVLILFATSAVQYTPFHPVDRKIVGAEQLLHLDLKSAIAWLNQNNQLKEIANDIYFSLSYQLLFIPLGVLLMRQYDALHQFYFLVLLTWLIGSLIYYFFPTMGPASVIDSPYFIHAQRDTGLKFWQLHHYIQPVTADGGMIAMPSFHVIWAWLCVWLVRSWPTVFVLMIAMNSILIVSCVFLGWHYFLDVIGSVLTVLLAHVIYHVCHKDVASKLC